MSTIKTALIPPRGLENYILHSTFHMAIAIPDCIRNWDYMSAYEKAALRGDYIVVDNGAADGGLVSNTDLLNAVDLFAANEVVVPDVFYNMTRTIAKVRDFLNFCSDHRVVKAQMMAVAQGTSNADFRNCIEAYAGMSRIDVVGLPRHMLTTLNAKASRIDLANWIEVHYPGRFKIHLLGTNPAWLKEVASVTKYAEHVRSVDSALPFNYALASQNLATTKVELTRNPEYYTLDWSESASAKTVSDNITTFMEWSSGNIVEASSFSQL